MTRYLITQTKLRIDSVFEQDQNLALSASACACSRQVSTPDRLQAEGLELPAVLN